MTIGNKMFQNSNNYPTPNQWDGRDDISLKCEGLFY